MIALATSTPLTGEPTGTSGIFLYRDSTFTHVTTSSSLGGGFLHPFLSADGAALVFSGDFDGGREIFLATCRPPLVTEIPTVSSLGLVVLGILLAMASLLALRRRPAADSRRHQNH